MKQLLLLILVLFALKVNAQVPADYEKIVKEFQQKIAAAKTNAEKVKLAQDLQKKLSGLTDLRDQAVKLANAKPSSAAALNRSVFCNRYKAIISFNTSQTTSQRCSNCGACGAYSNSSSGSNGMFTIVSNMCDNGGLFVFAADSTFNFSSSGSGGSTYQSTDRGCGQPSHSQHQFSYDPKKIPDVDFEFTSEEKWTVSLSADTKGETNNDGNVDAGRSSIWFSGSNENGNCRKEGKKFIISGSFNSNGDRPETKYLENSHVSYNITLIPDEQRYEAFIEPVDGWTTYKKWLPLGPDPKAPGTTGDSVLFKIYYVDKKKPTEKITRDINEVRYSFPQISKVPGYAMNFPRENISTLADLQLRKTAEEPDTTQEITELIIKAADDPSFRVKVESFDYGAYGKLSATITLQNGDVLQARGLREQDNFVTIPFCSNDFSIIADQWKQDEKAMSQEDLNDDEHDDKLGNNKYRGDGYSLYEEYRGFIENEKHFRSSATKKDIMICDKVKDVLQQEASSLRDTDIRKKSLGGRSRDGINIFADATGFITHSDFKSEEFGIDIGRDIWQGVAELDTLQLQHFSSSKVLNFNNWQVKHLHDQTGMLLLSTPLELGYAFASWKTENHYGPPAAWNCLVISKDFNPNPEGYSTTQGEINAAGTGIIVKPGGKAKIITDEYAVTVAHEMLHYCNVRHHGDREEKLWIFLSGKFVQGGVSDKVYYINPDDPKAVAVQIEVLLDDQNGTPLSGLHKLFEGNRQYKLKLSCQQGTCSGTEDCIMRYDDGRIFLKDGKYYLTLQTLEGGYSELTGITLCDAATGTGVNAKDHLPRPRYGDAQAGRGNCKAQVCINDKYD